MTDRTRPAAVNGWLYLVNDDLGGATQRVPETLTDADLDFHEARGWRPIDPPGEDAAPFVPQRVDVEPGQEFVELVHPETQHRHPFPNNPEALAGAAEVGWVVPNRDGSVPKPAAAKRRAATATAAIEDPPAAPAGEDSSSEQAERSATDQEE